MTEEHKGVDHHLDLETVYKHIDQLPTLPGVLFQLMQMDPDDSEFYEHVFDLAKSDPPLASFILGYANSAASSPNHKIDGLKSALTRVGSQTIVNMIMALSVTRVFVPSLPEHKAIWHHSIEVATIASFLSKISQEHEVDPEMTHMCGLLHDIGRFVLFQLAPDALNETDAKGWASPVELPFVEKEVIGSSHAEIGYLACKKLNLPSTLCSVVRHHHNYDLWKNEKVPHSFSELIIMVQFADFLSVFVDKNPHWAKLNKDTLKAEVLAHCVMPNWKGHALPIDSVVDALPTLMKKSSDLAKSLGV